MAEHNIFISWSGKRSQAMALALHQWLQDVIQAAKPFMSTRSIGAGSRSALEIAKQLESAKVGLICITPENQKEPWLNYEAGAISKQLEDSFVAPIILDMRKSDVEEPLGDFDANSIRDRESMFDVVTMVNLAIAGGLTEKQLERAFDKHWDELQDDIQARFDKLSDDDVALVTRRDSYDMLAEVLETVRGISAVVTRRPNRNEAQELLELSALLDQVGTPIYSRLGSNLFNSSDLTSAQSFLLSQGDQVNIPRWTRKLAEMRYITTDKATDDKSQ